MGTAYVFTCNPRRTSFDCHPDLGLVFASSHTEIIFLDNVVFNDRFKLIVHQGKKGDIPGPPTLHVVVLSRDPHSNRELETAWRQANALGAMLHRYTGMGQVFPHTNALTFPNVCDSWEVTRLRLHLDETGAIVGLYWDDPDAPVKTLKGKRMKTLRMRSLQSDFVLLVEHDQELPQTHQLHVSSPGTSDITEVDQMRRGKHGLAQMRRHGIDPQSETHQYLLQLYSKAISGTDVFTNTITMYQMVEVVVRMGSATRMSNEAKKRLASLLSSDPAFGTLADRLLNAAANVTAETTKERLVDGLRKLVGPEHASRLDVRNLPAWRAMRGKLVHPKEAPQLTEANFASNHSSLRSFWDSVVAAIYASSQSHRTAEAPVHADA